MNEPPDTYVTVSEAQLLAFATSCLEATGVPRGHAELVSRLLVDADLRGVRSHGTRQLNGYCQHLEQGALNPEPQVRTISDAAAVVALDGDGGLGYLPMMRAAEIAIERASRFGLGMATVRGIGHYGSAGHYARRCMEAGCIGFSVQGSEGLGNAGGHRPKPLLAWLGNPAICFAIPGGDTPGVVFDAATRIIPDDQIGLEAEALIPRIIPAVLKGIGYTAVAGLLGGALAGVTVRSESVRTRWSGAGWGGMVLAIRVAAALDETSFRAEVDRMVQDVAATYAPLPGHGRALLPGALEAERLERYRRDGVPYGQGEQEEARQVRQRLGVALPWDD
jgi:LDH2 family malate/lactate/ureidoglycolate dehydrogenase